MNKSLAKFKIALEKKHGQTVKVVEDSYTNVTTMCLFEDVDYGKWEGLPVTVKNGGRHPQYRKDRKTEKFSKPTEQLKSRLIAIHGDTLSYDWDTFKAISKKMRVIDKDFGEWYPRVALLLQGGRHKDRSRFEDRLSFEKVKQIIFSIHGNQVSIDEASYVNTHSKAIFYDIVYGEWIACVANVIYRGSSHPKRMKEKTQKTCLERYGVDSINKVPEIALKQAKSQTKSTVKKHWKTGKDLICQASWEPKVVDYLNFNKIEYDWQPKTFNMPNGKTYRPDLFLLDSNTWIEIKGYFRKDAKEKWDWFKTKFPDAQLWDKFKLKEMGIL